MVVPCGLRAPSQFFLDWIRANFRRPIEQACHEVLGKCPAIEFHVDASPAEGNGESAPPMEKQEKASHARHVPRATSPPNDRS